ncbi:hypothetical protein J2741_000429 [Methanolinea mesophila]|uniref:hypothetical protein n=1 Tax=Methanolinea mesophila TaxID=547055 RepID=UPI001AE30410|nr:hypothetical protein [Methanolinea mesophila]MBP1927882.1 hypothetical protein [Methanolinea mesophila]
MGGIRLSFLVGFILVLIILSSACIAPPRENPGGGTTGAATRAATPTPTTTTTTIIDTNFLTPVTPFPSESATPIPTPRNIPNPTPVPENYLTVYNNELAFKYNTVAYSYDLTDPPLIINICIKPLITTRYIWYQSRSGSKDDVTVKQTIVSPSAWFEVVVRDRNTGAEVLRDGFGKTYSIDTRKTVQVRSSGQYVVEFTGNDVNASILMQIKAPPGTMMNETAPVTMCPTVPI